MFLKDYSNKVYFENNSADDNKNMENYPACEDLKSGLVVDKTKNVHESFKRNRLNGRKCFFWKL